MNHSYIPFEPTGWHDLDKIGWIDPEFDTDNARDIPAMIGKCESRLNEVCGELSWDELDHPADLDQSLRLAYTCHVLVDRLAEQYPGHPKVSEYAMYRSQ